MAATVNQTIFGTLSQNLPEGAATTGRAEGKVGKMPSCTPKEIPPCLRPKKSLPLRLALIL